MFATDCAHKTDEIWRRIDTCIPFPRSPCFSLVLQICISICFPSLSNCQFVPVPNFGNIESQSTLRFSGVASCM